MASVTISIEIKIKAVGEALLQKRTLTEIAEEYGISCSYLSVLTNRARQALGCGGYIANKNKMSAVGEALLRNRTQTEISEEYGLSSSYLSILTKRIRLAIGSDRCAITNEDEKKSSETDGNSDLLTFIQMLKIAILQVEMRLKAQ